MEFTCFAVVVAFLIKVALCVPDEVLYLPSFEVRATDGTNRVYPYANAQFSQGNQYLMPQQRILHTAPVSPGTSHAQAPPTDRAGEHDDHNFTLKDVAEALSALAETTEEHTETRGAKKEFPRLGGFSQPPPVPVTSPASYPPYQGPYGPPPPPGYGSYAQPPYQAPPAYTPVVHAAPKTVKPLLSGLLKPTTTKMASKLSGLIGLILAMFSGGASDGLATGGLKDILINGIIKPLFVAKGGIKALISKLSIPVISLLLINVEVLITIWWLWEECPEPTYEYPKPAPAYDYHNNSY